MISMDNKCELHRMHFPKNMTVEWHHIIPVSWQLFSAAAITGFVGPSPGQDTDGRGMLWDDRGVWLCPTGHRNVHTWIVVMMHQLNGVTSDDPLTAYKACHPKGRVPPELDMAYQALTRFRAECLPGDNSSLLVLGSSGKWGQA